MMTEIQEAAERLVQKHGGLRKAARAIGIKAPYLCRLRSGIKVNPRPAVLRKLGLKKHVQFERI